MTFGDKKKVLSLVVTEQECDEILIRFLARQYNVDFDEEKAKVTDAKSKRDQVYRKSIHHSDELEDIDSPLRTPKPTPTPLRTPKPTPTPAKSTQTNVEDEEDTVNEYIDEPVDEVDEEDEEDDGDDEDEDEDEEDEDEEDEDEEDDDVLYEYVNEDDINSDDEVEYIDEVDDE